ncbi:MAG: hypothetical protein ABEJ95_06420 [Candidatus Nanohalobium sp.]
MADPGSDEIRECSSILDRRDDSRSYIEGNMEEFLDRYGDREAVAVTTDEGVREIAAVYGPDSESNQWQALSMIREFYSEETYLSSVVRELEERK